MRNARLDEPQAGIKTARRNIKNLRYANYTTLIAEIKKKENFPQLVVMHTIKDGSIVN